MESRSKNTLRNVFVGFGSRMLLLLLGFLTKTLFVRLLGAEYNGINGLYSNVLNVLSLAELGFGNVLNYSLYQALKDNNRKKLTTLVSEFKKIYRMVAAVVLGIGLLLIPALPYIVKSALPYNETLLYYILYLANSVVSYFVIYKTSIITADQKNYLSNIVTTASTVLLYALQILYLYFVRDFIGYLIIQILITIAANVTLNTIANRLYPFLKDKTLIEHNLVDMHQIKENVKATFVYKICFVMINNTDSILISIILGTVFVGYYANYYILSQYVSSFIIIITTGLTASIGNLIAENKKEKNYEVFKEILLIYNIIGSICVCCFVSCIQDFIPIWIGKDYVLSNLDMLSVVLLFYVNTTGTPVAMFREAGGLFKEVKYIMIAAVAVNIVSSIVLGHMIGLAGIIFSTSLAKISTNQWYEAKILYDLKFNKPVSLYYINQLKQLVCTIICLVLSYYVSRLVASSILGLFARVLLSALIALFFEMLLNYKTSEFEHFKTRMDVYKMKIKTAMMKQLNRVRGGVTQDSHYYSIDLLKVILTIEVIMCHFWSSSSGNRTEYIIGSLCACAAPTFMLLSFFLTKEIVICAITDDIHKREKRLAKPYIFWGIIAWIIISILSLGTKSKEEIIMSLLWQIYMGHSVNSPLWYLFVLILLTKVYSLIFQNCQVKHGLYFVALLMLNSLLLQYTGINTELFGGLDFEVRYPIGRIVEMIPFASAGILIKHWTEDRKNKGLTILTGFLMILLSFILPSIFNVDGFGYSGIKKLLFSSGLVLITVSVKLNLNEVVTKIIKTVSAHTLGVFCMHVIVGQVMMRIGDKSGSLLFCISVYIICYILAEIICRIGTNARKLVD